MSSSSCRFAGVGVPSGSAPRNAVQVVSRGLVVFVARVFMVRDVLLVQPGRHDGFLDRGLEEPVVFVEADLDLLVVAHVDTSSRVRRGAATARKRLSMS